MTKKTYMIIAIIIVVIVAGFMWWSGMRTEQIPETVAPIVPADTTSAIQTELDAIDIGNVDADFVDVDAAIKGL